MGRRIQEIDVVYEIDIEPGETFIKKMLQCMSFMYREYNKIFELWK